MSDKIIPDPNYKPRACAVDSVAFWYKACRHNQLEGKSSEAVMAMEQCFNHTENALVHVTDLWQAALKRLDETLPKDDPFLIAQKKQWNWVLTTLSKEFKDGRKWEEVP